MAESAEKTILLIDDDPAILMTVGDRLEFEGYRVIKAASAQQGLAALAQTPPDLILLDISMPGTSGLAMLKDLAGEDGKLKYPVLVLTARANMEEFFAQTAVDGFVAKASDPNHLLREVKRVLDQHARSAPPAPPPLRGSGRIMLVEDDPGVRNALRETLEEAGFETVCVADPHAAIEYVVGMKPDLMLIKLIMPRMNGSVIASTLADMQAYNQIPIILYDETGVHKWELRHRNVKQFISGNSPQMLLRSVCALLRNHRAGQ